MRLGYMYVLSTAGCITSTLRYSRGAVIGRRDHRGRELERDTKEIRRKHMPIGLLARLRRADLSANVAAKDEDASSRPESRAMQQQFRSTHASSRSQQRLVVGPTNNSGESLLLYRSLRPSYRRTPSLPPSSLQPIAERFTLWARCSSVLPYPSHAMCASVAVVEPSGLRFDRLVRSASVRSSWLPCLWLTPDS